MYVKSSNFAGWLHIDQNKVALCVMYQQKAPVQLSRGGHSLYEGYYICSAISTPLFGVSGKFV